MLGYAIKPNYNVLPQMPFSLFSINIAFCDKIYTLRVYRVGADPESFIRETISNVLKTFFSF